MDTIKNLCCSLTLLLALLAFNATADSDSDAPPLDSSPLSEAELQQLFGDAISDRDSGKIFSSIQKFEYLLSRRPSLNRARLELAVSYHRASRYDDALQEFRSVLDDPNTPESVRLSILAYLGQLTSDKLKPEFEQQFSYYAKVGVLYNTNINFAPLDGSLQYNIPDGQDTASPGLDTFFSVSHRYSRKKPVDTAGTASNFEWQSQVSWTGNNYTRKSDYNINILSLSTGPALISAGHWRSSVNIQIDQIFFGSSSLGTFTSLNPLITFDLGNYQGLTLEASYTDIRYSQAENDGRSGDSVLIGLAYSSLFSGTSNGLEAGIRLTDHSTDKPEFSSNNTEVYFGGFITTTTLSNYYLNVHFQQYDFKDADSFSGIIRDELESRYIIGYNYDFAEGKFKDWTLNTYASFTKNNSNVDAYSYEQAMIGVNLARYFQ